MTANLRKRVLTEIDIAVDAQVRVLTLSTELWDMINKVIDYGICEEYRLVRNRGFRYIEVWRPGIEGLVLHEPLLTLIPETWSG